MIPTAVLTKLATLGLSEAQAEAVAGMLTDVECATKGEADAVLEKGREKVRARVQKWRAKQPVTLPNVTERYVTAHASASPAPDLENKQTNKQESKRERASRLPDDWTLPDAWRDEAIAAGVPASRVPIEAKKMHNWSLSAKAGAKINWHATWQNWFQESIDRTPQAKAAAPPAPRNAGELSRLQLINGTTPHEPPINQPRRLDTSDERGQADGPGIARRFAIPANQFGRI